MSETTPASKPASAAAPLLPLAPLLNAIGDINRWKILRELAAGEPLMVTEIARAIGRSADVASKHLGVLRRAGITQTSRGLQKIVPRFLIDPTARVLELGYFQLQLGVEEPS